MTDKSKEAPEGALVTQVIENPNTTDVLIQNSLKPSFLRYSMTVIMNRALPDARDGLKPVHRRVLATMDSQGAQAGKPYKKVARVVGECFGKGSLVRTATGLEKIELCSMDTISADRSGTTAKTVALIHNEKSEVVKVSFEGNFSHVATKGQLYRVLNEDLSEKWVRASDLKSDDIIISGTTQSLARHVSAEDGLRAYSMGLLAAEGSRKSTNPAHKSVVITMVDREPLDKLQSYLSGIGVKGNIILAPAEQEGWLDKYALNFTGSKIGDNAFHELVSDKQDTRKVPDCILSDRDLYAPFLAGYFEGDGSVRVDGSEVNFASTSKESIYQIRAMLIELGIYPYLGVQAKKLREHNDLHTVCFAGRNVILFNRLVVHHLALGRKLDRLSAAEEGICPSMQTRIPMLSIYNAISENHIGSGWHVGADGKKFRLGSKNKNSKLRYSKDRHQSLMSIDTIISTGIFEKLVKIGSTIPTRLLELKNNRFVKVISVEPHKDIETFDIQIDSDSHEMIVDGFVVHNCMGKLHPHGDSSISEALVRLGQGFSTRYPLVDGQGNFGSIDGSPAAAMRYIESRMSKASMGMIEDLGKNTVEYKPNYDDSETEPTVLPSALPNMLINGSTGIAVGMATKMPPHNLREVSAAIKAVVANKEISDDELLAHVPGPDFPTGGIICGTQGIRDAYLTGNGKIKVRAKYKIETRKSGIPRIVFYEIPYLVDTSSIIEAIVDLVKNKGIEGISDVRDETTQKGGVRLVVDLKRDVNPEVIVNQLFKKKVHLQETFGVNNLALVGKGPRVCSLRDLIEVYVKHRREVILRAHQFDLDKAAARAHILEGLKVAQEDIDGVVAIVRVSVDQKDAKAQLSLKYNLSDIQSDAIVAMRLGQLTNLDVNKIANELSDVNTEMTKLKHVIATPSEIDRILVERLDDITHKFGDERRTTIEADAGDIEDEDMIPDDDMVVTISKEGYIKRVGLDTYKTQGRGGVGVNAANLKDEDYVTGIHMATNKSYLMIFTSLGRAHWLKVWNIPEGTRTGKGKALVNLINLQEGEKVQAVVPVKSFDDDHFFMFATKNGTINKMAASLFSNVRKAGVNAINIVEGDSLVSVLFADASENLVLATANGQAISFKSDEFRSMGRGSTGVRGIRLGFGDEVVGFLHLSEGSKILTVTKNGYGKRTNPDEYRVTGRGGKGVRNITVTNKTGAVVFVSNTQEDDELVVSTKAGIIIRTKVSTISTQGRAAQGVKVISIKDGNEVVDATCVASEDAEVVNE